MHPLQDAAATSMTRFAAASYSLVKWQPPKHGKSRYEGRPCCTAHLCRRRQQSRKADCVAAPVRLPRNECRARQTCTLSRPTKPDPSEPATKSEDPQNRPSPSFVFSNKCCTTQQALPNQMSQSTSAQTSCSSGMRAKSHTDYGTSSADMTGAITACRRTGRVLIKQCCGCCTV